MNFLSAHELPEDVREPHASDYRRKLALALRDPTIPERQKREIALLLSVPSGEKPYAALAAFRKES